MSALEIARGFLRRGWSPIPIPYKTKAPLDKGWPDLRVTEETAPQWFNGEPQNVGVRLGEMSGGLADVDLDSPAAVYTGGISCRGHYALAALPNHAATGCINPIFGKPKTKPQFNSSSPPARAKTAKSK